MNLRTVAHSTYLYIEQWHGRQAVGIVVLVAMGVFSAGLLIIGVQGMLLSTSVLSMAASFSEGLPVVIRGMAALLIMVRSSALIRLIPQVVVRSGDTDLSLQERIVNKEFKILATYAATSPLDFIVGALVWPYGFYLIAKRIVDVIGFTKNLEKLGEFQTRPPRLIPTSQAQHRALMLEYLKESAVWFFELYKRTMVVENLATKGAPLLAEGEPQRMEYGDEENVRKSLADKWNLLSVDDDHYHAWFRLAVFREITQGQTRRDVLDEKLLDARTIWVNWNEAEQNNFQYNLERSVQAEMAIPAGGLKWDVDKGELSSHQTRLFNLINELTWSIHASSEYLNVLIKSKNPYAAS